MPTRSFACTAIYAGAADEDEKIKAATQGSIEIAQKAFARAKDLLEELGVTQ